MALGGAIAVAVVIAFAPGTRAPFYFDDVRIIVDDATLQWDELSLQRVSDTLAHATLRTRPVANLSLAVNHRFGGLDPTGYHWTNIAIHLAVGAALAWLAFLIASAGGASRRASLLGALAAAALFCLHPLGIQAVTYVVQRMAALAALFSLLALALYVSARRSERSGRARIALYAGAAASWALALGSKENAVTLMPVVASYELCFHGARWRERIAAGWRRGPAARLALAAAPVLLLALLVAVAAGPIEWGALRGRDFTGVERVLTQARVQGFYLSLLIWPSPSRLGIEHDFAISRSLTDPWTTVPALLAVAAVAALALALAWRGRRPRYVFPVLAYLAFHSVESAPLSLELVFEHRMYLPSAMLAILIACAIADLAPRRRSIALAACAAVACTLAVATYQRNRTWGDELAFWEDTVAKTPRLPRAHVGLGHAYAEHGRYEEAAREFQTSIDLEPTAKAHYNLGNILWKQLGRQRDGIAHLHAAAALDAGYASPHTMLGMIAEGEGRLADAERELAIAARLEPTDPTARADLGRIYLRQGRYRAAIVELEAASRFGPQLVGAHNNLAIAYVNVGRRADAIEELRKSLAIDPANEAARVNLDRLLRSGR